MDIKKKIVFVFNLFAIVVSLIDVFFGIMFQIKQVNFKKSSVMTDGHIYQISKQKDGNKIIYFNYNVNDMKYDGIFVYKNTNKDVSNKIKVYYDKNNPSNYTDGSIKNNGFYLMFLGCFILLFSLFQMFFQKYRN